MNMWNLNVSPDASRKKGLRTATVHDFMYDPELEKYDTQVIAYGTSNSRRFSYKNTFQLN